MRGSHSQPMTFERFRQLSQENMQACVNFLENWERLSAEGACDSVGGAEFNRVFLEYLKAGKPMLVAEFIRERANLASRNPPDLPPDTEGAPW